jgi:hypothetical protein
MCISLGLYCIIMDIICSMHARNRKWHNNFDCKTLLEGTILVPLSEHLRTECKWLLNE